MPTIRWAGRILRDSPLVVVIAVVASSVQVLGFTGYPIRTGMSLLAVVVVGSLAAIIGEDTVLKRDRTIGSQARDLVGALAPLLVTVAVFAPALYFGVFLPIAFVPYLGLAFGIVVGVYLIALLCLAVPSVVLDRSIGRGRTAFAEARPLAVAVLAVLALGHAPLIALAPTRSEPVVALGLVVWAGLVTAVTTLAFTRVYIANRSEQTRRTGGGGAQKQAFSARNDGIVNLSGGGSGSA